MDKEFKGALSILLGLLGIAVLLLEVLAKIHFWSPEFFRGFVPFTILFIPYVLFSSSFFFGKLRQFTEASFLRKLVFPAGIALSYLIAGLGAGNFDKILLLKIILWLLAPVALLSVKSLQGLPGYPAEFLAALILWLPLEFGLMPGFDIIFREGIQIPAFAFAAPVAGLYYFVILRGLPDVGYNFRWRAKDIGKVLLSLFCLSLLLIPIGTHLGFISLSSFDTSAAEMLKLLFGIYFLVALPEELLFRGIIQNLLTRMLGRFKGSFWIALVIASVIFGLSHYNNFDPPDYRYVFLAALAGLFYGWTYHKTGKTTVSALVHCGVNLLWAVLFKGTSG